MLTVITGWSPRGWDEYAKRFVDTFVRHWPDEVRCIAYVEELKRIPERIEQRLIWDIPGCGEFIERHRGNAAANGRAPTPKWKEGDRRRGYSFKWDAWKFSRQAFIPLAAALELGEGLMCWLDADVVTYRDIPNEFVASMLPDDADVAYLGRKRHSEIGFQLYRIPAAMPLLQRFSDYYTSDEVFQLGEWHSAFVWDRAREQSGVRAHNLTPGGDGHVWFKSRLGDFTDHAKGARKASGVSPERPR